MSAHHFMRDDLLGSLAATVLFSAFLLTPGYAIGWLANVRDFRRQPRAWRILWSLALSVGVTPVIAWLLGSFAGMWAVWGFYGACALTAGILAVVRKPAGEPQKWPRWLAIAAVTWMAVAILSGIDVQWGARLYPSVLIYDYNVRTAVIDGISRQGLPAINPLFYPGHFVPLRYHYFWFIPCSLVQQIGGGIVSSRHALIASGVWCGWVLIATVLLYLRYFRPGGDALGRRGIWACLLLSAAGLDVLPNALAAAIRWSTGKGVVYPSAEWWNNPVSGCPDASLWVAHHVAGAIACLCGFLLLWKRDRADRWAIALAGACFASATGLSIYVAFTFALCMAVWIGWAAWLRNWRTVRECALAGALASALALPYLLSMTQASGSGGSFVQLTVRSFTVLEGTLASYGWSWTAIAAANFVALPLNYFLEAAMMMTIVWLVVKRRWRLGFHSDESRAEMVLIAIPLLVATFLKSGVITNNDLGWRAPLLAQGVAVVAGVDIVRALIGRARRWASLERVRRLAVVVLVLGMVSTAWDLLAMRTYPMLADAGWAQPALWLTDRDIGLRTFAMREVYEDLRRRIPRDAVVQGNPKVWDQVFLGAYAQRQTASLNFDCAAVMGGDPGLCAKMQPGLLRLFNDPGAGSDLQSVCRASGLSALVFEERDPVVRDGWSAVGGGDALASNNYARAFPCGGRR
jgi:hypothetical protein